MTLRSDLAIASIETFPVRCPIPEPLTSGSSKGCPTARTATFVKVTTSSGCSGWGECFGDPVFLVPFLEKFARACIGRPVEQREERLLSQIATAYHLTCGGPHVVALSGLDIAAWDAQARHLGVPLSALLGGRTRDRVFAYASGGFFRREQDWGEFAAQIESYVAQGFLGAKIRIGTGLREDRRRAEIARKILGPDRLLMVDYNCNQTFDTARRSIEALRDLDIAWFEEPLPPQDIEGWHMLRTLGVTLSGGEALATRYGFRDAVSDRLFDIYQPDLGCCGGLTEGLAIKAMVLAQNARIAPHCFCGVVGQAAALQLSATLPTAPFGAHAGREDSLAACFECDVGYNPIGTEAATTSFHAENSVVTIPDGPGLGIDMDEEWLRAHLIDGCKVCVDA